ncbi:MAG: nitrous oxide reductase accessory protein NosL, partial [Magnetococcus sp. WYHC-3]
MQRRTALKTLAGWSTAVLTLGSSLAHAEAHPPVCPGDGTPLQFMPRTPRDTEPLKDELSKYPRCPYCGMDRRQWHHSRHLIHYSDGLADGTCSLHCAAISLSLNLDRSPVAIYAADFAAPTEPRPLIQVDTAHYLVGSALKGTMSSRSKMAFASAGAAEAARTQHGGEITNFDAALTATYTDMARDTVMIRKRRAERMKHQAQQAPGAVHDHAQGMMEHG